MKEKYFAIIVTYQPEIERVKKTVCRLQEQGFYVIVVDNHSNNIDKLEKINHCTSFVFLNENKGIAAALNVGMREAVSQGATWILSLDQDTEIAENLLEEYKKYLLVNPEIGALCPGIIKRGEKQPPISNVIEQTDRCPTSGFFIKALVWDIVGEYNEWMFIDYVDYDMCMRLKLLGYSIYRVNTTHIVQELGKQSVNQFWNTVGCFLKSEKLKNFAITYNHTPSRNYYYVRNCLYYMQTYKSYIDVKAEKRRLFKWEIKKFLLEPHKLEILVSIKNAIRDFKGAM